MATYRTGSRGSAVKELQQQLLDAGFDPGPIDGIYGPKTKAAVTAYQKANDLTVDGIAGPQTLGSLGGTAPDGADAPVVPVGEGARMSLPGTPELWRVGDEDWVVYMVPGTENDPVYMHWVSRGDDDTASFFGPNQPVVYDREMEADDVLAKESMFFGGTSELANMDSDPFDNWTQTLAAEALTQPWILDEDYQALIAMAVLEGRSLTQAEVQGTNWYSKNTQGQRDWQLLFHSDPATAEQNRLAQIEQTRATLTAAGMGTDVPNEVVEYMATQFLTGNWDQTQYTMQISAISDPSSGFEVDAALATIIGGTALTTTISKEQTVRDLLHRWLGPAYGEWDDSEIARIAGEFRADPEAEERFIEGLKDSRMAVMPEYTDREQSYQSIANVWKQTWLGTWGESPDETSDLWRQYLGFNSSTDASRLLRTEGLRIGNEKVINDANSQTRGVLGGLVRE